jgi:hypothetical protein
MTKASQVVRAGVCGIRLEKVGRKGSSIPIECSILQGLALCFGTPQRGAMETRESESLSIYNMAMCLFPKTKAFGNFYVATSYLSTTCSILPSRLSQVTIEDYSLASEF